MSEQAAPPDASPQRVGRRAVKERGACGGGGGEERAGRGGDLRRGGRPAPPEASPRRVGRRAVKERGACGGAAVDERAERCEATGGDEAGTLGPHRGGAGACPVG